MAVQLSRRLRVLADMVPHGASVVDVGTDHALLPTYLALGERIQLAIASDIAAGPCEAARRTVADYGASHRVHVRLGSGLETVQPGEVDTAVLAGMGGGTMVEIFRASPDVFNRLRTVIVQPMNASEAIRRYLYEQNALVQEELVLEDEGRLYELSRYAIPKERDSSPDEAFVPYRDDPVKMHCAMQFGPYNLERGDTYVQQLVNVNRVRWTHIRGQLDRSDREESYARKHALDAWIEFATGWLAEHETGGTSIVRWDTATSTLDRA